MIAYLETRGRLACAEIGCFAVRGLLACPSLGRFVRRCRACLPTRSLRAQPRHKGREAFSSAGRDGKDWEPQHIRKGGHIQSETETAQIVCEVADKAQRLLRRPHFPQQADRPFGGGGIADEQGTVPCALRNLRRGNTALFAIGECVAAGQIDQSDVGMPA